MGSSAGLGSASGSPSLDRCHSSESSESVSEQSVLLAGFFTTGESGTTGRGRLGITGAGLAEREAGGRVVPEDLWEAKPSS